MCRIIGLEIGGGQGPGIAGSTPSGIDAGEIVARTLGRRTVPVIRGTGGIRRILPLIVQDGVPLFFITDHQPSEPVPRGAHGKDGFRGFDILVEANRPPDEVAREERDVASIGDEGLHVVAHLFRPVLVVSDANVQLMRVEILWIRVEIPTHAKIRGELLIDQEGQQRIIFVCDELGTHGGRVAELSRPLHVDTVPVRAASGSRGIQAASTVRFRPIIVGKDGAGGKDDQDGGGLSRFEVFLDDEGNVRALSGHVPRARIHKVDLHHVQPAGQLPHRIGVCSGPIAASLILDADARLVIAENDISPLGDRLPIQEGLIPEDGRVLGAIMIVEGELHADGDVPLALPISEIEGDVLAWIGREWKDISFEHRLPPGNSNE